MFQVDLPTAVSSLPSPAAAGTPGYFTNGNPVAGIPATILEADFTNMLMMELVNVVLAGGLTPSKTTYTQVRDAIKQLIQGGAGVSPAIGSMTNATVNLTTASNSLNFKADQVVLGTALSGLSYTVPSVNLTINTTQVGANGMNTGLPAVSSFVNVYLLFNPTTSTAVLLGVNDAGTVPPMICAASGIPSGYTASALVGAYWTNGSGLFQPVMQYNRRIFCSLSALISGAGNATLQGAIWAGVPSAARTISGAINITNTGSSSDTVALYPLSTGGPGSKGVNRNSSNGGVQAPFSDLPINPATPRTSWYTITSTAGSSIAVTIFATDYTI